MSDNVQIHSPVEKITNLEIRGKIPADLKIKRMVTHGNVRVYESMKGFLYCQSFMTPASYTIGKYEWTKGFMECLVNLKRITRDEANIHLEAAQAVHDRIEVDTDVKTISRIQEKYGVLFCEACIHSINLKNMLDEAKRKQMRKSAENAMDKLV